LKKGWFSIGKRRASITIVPFHAKKEKGMLVSAFYRCSIG